MLREKIQRRLCRTTFFLACVLPTLAVAILVGVRCHPQWRGTVMRQVSDAVGLRLECDRVTTPRPGVIEVEGLRIADPATGRRIARCDRARWVRSRGQWVVAVRELSVESTALCGAAIASRIAKHDGALATLQANSVLVTSPEGTCSCWRGLRCELSEQGPALVSLRAWVEDSFGAARPSATPLVSLSHDVTGAEPLAKLVVTTGEANVPCWLLAGAPMPVEAARGGAFSGVYEALCAANGTFSDCSGGATGAIDFAPRLDGAAGVSWRAARVDLRDARWEGGRLSRLHANANARQGALDRTVIVGLNQRLGCRPCASLYTAWNLDPERPVPFDDLACEVELTGAGLSVIGQCGEIIGKRRGGAIAHAVLARDDEPMLLEPAERSLPVMAIVRAMWPDDEVVAPATQGAQALARRLPLAATGGEEIVR
ncbi:MAG: hypothetical protein ACRCT8_17565 [Lacipirellulaceae bacterium]